ncbi:AhpC/TSA antioxidant enzyme-domain-containing protein [Aspergillus caelatus]|uniref:AhpC/TSA antioxidant enzyme-domain-containing protein n=1 Tax=Aspergillus caelatus TaxID=61420 RepID=A0A5N7A034_9EURO|nr:AhpC/TSA antioxidant enzyme-domain-containing protein [Aspergillus caelatus]KAE8363221.1 AhpC/TSA antioxidant enzyme-domain-containing protein [Aspergillus caelatus]
MPANPPSTAEPRMAVDATSGSDQQLPTENLQDFQGEVQANDQPPSAEILRKIQDYSVLDRHGKSHPFKSLYSGPGVAQRVLVIFVRHFFCGSCQEFLRTLSASITPGTLEPLAKRTSVVIIGCGDPALIEMYGKETNCQFPIYADPTRQLYQDLDMMCSSALGSQPGYIRKGMARIVGESMFQAMKHIPSGLAHKGGWYKQNGGEFLFEPLDINAEITGEQEKQVTWCYRMETTRDHTEIPDLMRVLGIDQKNVPN